MLSWHKNPYADRAIVMLKSLVWMRPIKLAFNHLIVCRQFTEEVVSSAL